MKKVKFRSVFSVVLCAMLVFSVGFYSSAEPTTAYFSDTGDVSKEYAMKELYVDFLDSTGNKIPDDETLVLQFDAATDMLDEIERANMFEHAAKYFMFTASNLNTSEINAQLKIDIVPVQSGEGVSPAADLNYKGLRYFIYEVSAEDKLTDASGVTELIDGVYENADGSCVIRWGDDYYDSKLADKLEEKISADVNDENEFAFLVDASKQSEHLAPGASKTYCICFWADYNQFLTQATENDDVRTLDFNVDVKLSAEQCDGTELENT